MKTIVKTYDLATTGKILQIPLVVLMRAAGTGEASEGELPAEFLDKLLLNIMRPGVSGAVRITTDTRRPVYYTVDGSNLVLSASGLDGGVNRVKIITQYGTNTRSLLIIDLNVPENILWLRSDEQTLPLQRMPEKDGELEGVRYYAYGYAYAEQLVWLTSEEHTSLAGNVTALYGESLDTELADAVELTNARLVRNYQGGEIFDPEEVVDLSAVESFGAGGSGMEQYRLTLVTGRDAHFVDPKGNRMTFEDVKAAVLDPTKFVYLDHADCYHIPCFVVDEEGNEAIGFTSTFSVNGAPHVERVAINQDGQINTHNYELLSTESEWYGTQEEYDAIAEKDPKVTYYIYEEE